MAQLTPEQQAELNRLMEALSVSFTAYAEQIRQASENLARVAADWRAAREAIAIKPIPHRSFIKGISVAHPQMTCERHSVQDRKLATCMMGQRVVRVTPSRGVQGQPIFYRVTRRRWAIGSRLVDYDLELMNGGPSA